MVYMLTFGGILMVNVTIYGIHGSYGLGIYVLFEFPLWDGCWNVIHLNPIVP